MSPPNLRLRSGGPGRTFAGIGSNNANTNTYVYFTDRDGDGLVDVVVYGQVFYGQGEVKVKGADGSESYVVSFVPKSALTPPIPASVAVTRLDNRFAPEVRDTVRQIETRIAALSRRLQNLRYT
jgi:hypothetical protein